MQYSLYQFYTRNEIERSWLISILQDFYFEGFEETSDSLNAYVHSHNITTDKVQDILAQNELAHIEFSSSDIQEKNWNEEWEKNFEPVVIGGRVAIRAPFHAPQKTDYEIVIEPKMSFGTGHHATTASVVALMLKQNFENKTVLDFGSGTGVLAILAEKLKAKQIVAIDNEEWAYNNCIENVERNNCICIKTIKGDDTFVFSQQFDIILANINRNVILKNIGYWKNLMNPNAVLIVSGILQSDEKDVVAEAAKNNLHATEILNNNGWLAVKFTVGV